MSSADGRVSQDTDPSCRQSGVPVVQSATGSRAAIPTSRSWRRHSSSIVGRWRGEAGFSLMGRSPAERARAVRSLLASSLRRYSGSLVFPLACCLKISAVVVTNGMGTSVCGDKSTPGLRLTTASRSSFRAFWMKSIRREDIRAWCL